MSETLLWHAEDLAPFLRHPQIEVRRWAAERLIKLFPGQAAPHLLTVLDDPDRSLHRQVTDFLGRQGDAEACGPELARHLSGASGQRISELALALARLGYRAALPALLERVAAIATGSDLPDMSSFRGLTEALGIFGGGEARGALWQLVERFPLDDEWRGAAVQGLLQAAQPADVVRLIGRYRALPPVEEISAYLDAFAMTVGAGRLNDEIRRPIRDGFAETLDAISSWLGSDPGWSDACYQRLERAFRRTLEDVPAIAFDEARRLIAERGDDVAGWQAAWEGGADLLGYRRQAVLTLLVLQGLLDQRKLRSSQRHHVAILSLALLSQLSVDRDDQLALETAADRVAALLDILTTDRENILPEIVEQVAALGPEIVPRLLERFDPEDPTWAPIRIARTLTLLARNHPGSCDAAIPLLITAIDDDQGDFLLEAGSAALAAIGPAAVPAVAEHLTDEGIARPIYLSGVLGDIPTEDAVRALLGAMAQEPDIMHYGALADIGSSLAIPPLYALHKDDSSDWVYHMLILCEVNGVTLPELPQWRTHTAEQERRVEQLLAEIVDLGAEEAEEDEEAPTLEGLGLDAADIAPATGRAGVKPKKGSASKRARRHRATQRKKQRRKK